MEFRNEYHHDIECGDVFMRTLGAAIICIVIFGLGVLISWGENTRKSDIEFNEYVTEFNALPESTRIVAAPFIKYELPEGKTVLEFKPVADEYGTQLGGAMPTIIKLFLLVLSLTTFFSYWYEKNSSYFLADLPMRTPYGWVLLISMFAGWPILIISFIRMMRCKYRREIKKEIEAIEEQLEDDDLTYEKPNSPIALARMRKARTRYINYRVDGRQKAIKHMHDETTALEEAQRKDLQKLGEQIKRQQRLIGETLAEKQRLADVKVTEQETREKAMAEWDTIAQMRGVSVVSVKRPKGEKIQPLTLDVKVRVPYKGELCDFGDYRVVISGSKFSCTRIRSGVKVTASSNSPNYNESGGFCFGSGKHVITDYVRNGRLLEAITLIVDSLHSVNDKHDEAQIPNCFRRVATVKRVERWLKIKKKLGVNA
ncbi:MAG: hypothetical protein ACK5MU_03250 [Candidatus Saccharimonadales bacterium]